MSLTLAPRGSWSRDWIQGWAWPWPSWGHLGIRDLLLPSPAILLLHLSTPNTSLVLHILPMAGHRHSQMSLQHPPLFRGVMESPTLLASQ